MRIAFLGDSLTEGRPGESFLARLGPLLPGDELVNHGRAGDTIPGLLARLEAGELAAADLAVVWIGTNDAFLGDWYLPPLFEADGAGDGDEAGPSTGAGGATAGDRAARALRPLYDRILELTLRCAPRAVCVPPVLPDPFEEGGIADRVCGIDAMVAAAAAARGPHARLFALAPVFAAAAGEQVVAGAAGGGPAGAAAAGDETRPRFTLDGVHLNARGADVVAHAFRELIGASRGEGPASPPPP